MPQYLVAGYLPDDFDPSQMDEAVGREIPGARMTIMKGMGHFPMVENYRDFRPFLLAELDVMAR